MKLWKLFNLRAETILFAVALLIGIGGSIVLWFVVSPGHKIAQSKDGTEVENASPKSTPSTTRSTSSVSAALANVLELESPTDRTIALYSLVGGMNGDQIRVLLNETLSLKASATLTSVQTTLLAELTWLDPLNALSFVDEFDVQRSVELVSTVFAEWAQFNLDDALQSTSDFDGAKKTRALWAIFFSRPDLSIVERVALVEQHGGSPILVRRLVTESSMHQFLDQPLTALQTIIDDEIDDSQQIIALYRLTDFWYDRAGISSIGEMLDRFYYLFRDQHSLLRNLVKKVSAFDPPAAWNHVLTLPFEVRQRLANMVVEEWGMVDFDNAHRAIMDANMSSELGVLFRSLARSNPERALAEIDQVPSGYGMSVYMQLLNRLPRDVLLEHLEQHGSLGPETDSATRLLFQIWSSQAPENAVEWLLTNSSKFDWIKSVHLLDGLIALGSVDLERAFAIALEQPKAESATGMEFLLLLGVMRKGRFEDIEELLRRVRKPKQFDIYPMTGDYLIEFGKFDEAFELGNQLPESEWSEYFRRLTSKGIWRDSARFIEKMPRLPNKDIRVEIARYILELKEMTFYPSRMSISDSDVQYLQTLLKED